MPEITYVQFDDTRKAVTVPVGEYLMRGVLIKKCDRVLTILPSATFDPEVFPNPLDVDFDRPRKTILAFTVGVHSCMGRHLAHMELKIALQEWLKRIPSFAVKPGGVVGPAAVPLVW